jgi:hypothetical protein
VEYSSAEKTSFVEPLHFHAVPVPAAGENFDANPAAPAPSLFNSSPEL